MCWISRVLPSRFLGWVAESSCSVCPQKVWFPPLGKMCLHQVETAENLGADGWLQLMEVRKGSHSPSVHGDGRRNVLETPQDQAAGLEVRNSSWEHGWEGNCCLWPFFNIPSGLLSSFLLQKCNQPSLHPELKKLWLANDKEKVSMDPPQSPGWLWEAAVAGLLWEL